MGGGQFLDFMGGHSCYEGDIELMGGPPSPPTRENPGGELHKNVSQILTTVDFSSAEIAGKSLSVRKNFKGNINLGQTSRLNWDKIWHRQLHS